MDTLGVDVLLAAFFCILTCYRLLLILFRWSLKRALNVDVEIQGLGFISVYGIKITLPKITLDIQRISLRFSNAGREKICIFVDGISVVGDKRALVNDSPGHGHQRDEVHFQISPELVAITKWIEVEIRDLSIHSELAGQCLLRSSTPKVELYFLEHDTSQCVIAKVNLYTTTVAVCATPLIVESSVRDILPAEHRLILSWNTSIEATASLADDTFSLQKLAVEVDRLDVEIKENLSALMYGNYHQEIMSDLPPVAKQSLKDTIHQFSTFIPKDFHFGIHGVEVSGMKGSPSPYTMSIFSCSLEISNIVDKQGNLDVTRLNPNVSIGFCISDVEMEINLLEAIKIEEFSVVCKVQNKVLNSDVILKSVAVVYHHEELMKWLQVNFKKPMLNKHNSNISALGNNSCANYGYGILLPEADVTVQMSRFTAKYFLSPREVSEAASLNLDFLKLKYEKPQGMSTDELALNEIIMKNLWCHLGRMPFDLIYRRDKHHTWGSPMFIQLLRVEKPKPYHPGPVDVLLSYVEIEWTPGLPQVALGALRCMVDFQKAVSDLFMQKVVEKKPNGLKLSSYHQSSSMNLTMLDCNVYLLDDLVAKDRKKVDLCYMLRFDTIMYQSSREKIHFDVEGFKAITILQDRTGQHACALCEALKGYWLNVKSLHGFSHQPFGEMTIRLKERVELFWSQDLHSRFFGMTSSVQDFCQSLTEVFPRKPHSQRNAECSMSLTIGIDCQAKVVVDLFQSKTQLYLFFSEATYMSTDQGRCIKAFISNVHFLKGALLGLNSASFFAFYNQFSKGYIHHQQSNTSLYISLDPKVQQNIQATLICEFLFLIMLAL